MTEDQKTMIAERERVSALLAQAVSDMEQDGGNIRFFSAAFLTAAVQLHVEIEGPENLDTTITKIGVRELSRVGAVTQC